MQPEIVGILERFDIINENISPDENDEISGYSGSSKYSGEESSENEYSELSVKKRLKTAFEKVSAPIKKKKRTEISPAKDLNSIVRKEITYFIDQKIMGKHLKKVYYILSTVKTTSVDSERVLSSAGNFVTKIRSRLNDNSVDILCFLKARFNKEYSKKR
ncbi:hypothetical protein AYI70_g6540 [Smittium culicis]|uniref:Uncharacterized protein n=1 Tax=Smittium culicis TaxID=133412 RepID=A0A1R1XPE2_9FUNG|nr:hypothetical protein AYI70_g6540 [Smittium culicis]